MLRNSRREVLVALVLIAPFLAIYLLAFVYPTVQMFRISFTDAPLIGEGQWVGLDNYLRLDNDPMFRRAAWNTAYFVLMTVVPGTLIALLIALGVSRLKGRFQAMVLALFFLPYILPVSVVYLIWDWTLNFQFGIAMHVLDWLGIPRVPVFKSRVWFLPAVAGVTIWWTAGFSILLFLAGLRAIPAEIYEAAALDNSTRWTTFRRITWPLLWPITSLVFTIQLILQLKIFDQVYLFSIGGRPNDNMVLVYYVFHRAFQQDQGGRAAAAAVTLFVLVVVVSVLQFQLLRLPKGGANECRGCATLELLGRGDHRPDARLRAVLWAFPLYWGVISSLKPDDEVVRPYIELWPETPTLENYIDALTTTQIGAWYVNSVAVAVGVTVICVFTSMLCGYAISQLRFPGRIALWWLILASFMVPISALIINHFVLVAEPWPAEQLGRHHVAAAYPPRHNHCVQTVLRSGSAGLPRGRGHGQRVRVRDPLQGLHADELGGDDGAVDRLLHLDVERVLVAVPLGDPHRDDDDHRRHHASQ